MSEPREKSFLPRRFSRMMPAIITAAVLFAGSARGDFVPWAPLVDDSWIYFGPPQTRMVLHTVNGGDYSVGFDQATTKQSARGLNALRFSYQGSSTGHLSSQSPTGSFGVLNTGDNRTFADLVLLIAIDAAALPDGFSLTLGKPGEVPYQFDVGNDFAFYDHPEYHSGRPTGYYSATSPAREEISYAFASGMVSVFALPNVGLGPGGAVQVDYAFDHLPGTAVFSVYGYDDGVGWIYHTNRGVVDTRNPGGAVSTFEVVPEPSALIILVGAGLGWILRRR